MRTVLSNSTVCFECGVKYLTPKQKEQGGAVTAHLGHCVECKESKLVTHIRHYNYLKKNETD